jgi:hypothetical protein
VDHAAGILEAISSAMLYAHDQSSFDITATPNPTAKPQDGLMTMVTRGLRWFDLSTSTKPACSKAARARALLRPLTPAATNCLFVNATDQLRASLHSRHTTKKTANPRPDNFAATLNASKGIDGTNGPTIPILAGLANLVVGFHFFRLFRLPVPNDTNSSDNVRLLGSKVSTSIYQSPLD